MTAKPSVSELGIDLAAQVWQRSGRGDGAIEVAFARVSGPQTRRDPETRRDEEIRGDPETRGFGRWVLMRVSGDPQQRVLVFDRNEWECFLDGARNGEFDDAAEVDDAAEFDDAQFNKQSSDSSLS